MTERCDACAQSWAVRFEWDYTSPERYCEAHILELLDYMPDCQRISHRLTSPGRIVRYSSTAALYPILTGRLWKPSARRS